MNRNEKPMAEANDLAGLRAQAKEQRADLSRSFWSLVSSPGLLFISAWLLSFNERAHGRWYTTGGITDLAAGPDSTKYLPVESSTLALLDVLGWAVLIVSIVLFMFGMRAFLVLIDLWETHKQISDEVAASTTREGLSDLAARFEPQVIETIREVPVIRAPEEAAAAAPSPSS